MRTSLKGEYDTFIALPDLRSKLTILDLSHTLNNHIVPGGLWPSPCVDAVIDIPPEQLFVSCFV